MSFRADSDRELAPASRTELGELALFVLGVAAIAGAFFTAAVLVERLL